VMRRPSRILRSGMVLTIAPGTYVSDPGDLRPCYLIANLPLS
jgi:hypothetical protein